MTNYWTHVISRLQEPELSSLHLLYCNQWARLTDCNGRQHMIYPNTRWSDIEATILLVQSINKKGRTRNRIRYYAQ